MEKKLNVFLVPTFSDENEYLNNVTKGLINSGVNVISKSCNNKRQVPIKSVWNAITHNNYIVHFNWIENKVNYKNLKSYFNYAFIVLWISILKFCGAKIAWTMHNKKPHLTDGNNLVDSFYKYLLGRCDLVVVHCKESRKILKGELGYKGNILCIPHGNYCESENIDNFSSMKELNFLYFGAVSKYKNIPVLISAFKNVVKKYPNANLNICGRCREKELDDEIRKECQNCSNIYYENKFLSSEEMKDKIGESCAVVLPYDKESMLNSGSVIQAFSLARGVIVPLFGYIYDIKGKEFVISYDYDDLKNHANRLSERWIQAIGILGENRKEWNKIGKMAYQFAETELDWNKICEQLALNYKKLMKNM